MINRDNIIDLLKKSIANPLAATEVLQALFRGILIKSWYRLFNSGFSAGSNFRAYSWIHIKGPGRVIIGDNVTFGMGFLIHPFLLTHTPESLIQIHNGCNITGTRISCVSSVKIGSDTLLGSATIVDSDIIPHENMILDDEWKSRFAHPVTVGNHCWCGINSIILGESNLGNECVLGAGAVIGKKVADDRSLLIGNPARKIGVTREV